MITFVRVPTQFHILGRIVRQDTHCQSSLARCRILIWPNHFHDDPNVSTINPESGHTIQMISKFLGTNLSLTLNENSWGTCAATLHFILSDKRSHLTTLPKQQPVPIVPLISHSLALTSLLGKRRSGISIAIIRMINTRL